MAKKIRFSLEMENGRKIRTLDELRENFSLTKVVEYFDDQKLFHWLEDRYYTEQVEKLKQLNREDADFYRKICHIFEVEYREKDEDIDEKLEVEKRKAQLKQFTDDKTVLEHVHQVAFNQDEWEYPKVCVNLQTGVRYNYSVWRFLLWQEEKVTHHRKQQCAK